MHKFSKANDFQRLLKILGDIKNEANDLDGKISEIKDRIGAAEFIPTELIISTREILDKIERKQNSFASEYEALEMGPLPKNFEDIISTFEKCIIKWQEAEGYFKAIEFFLSLHSDDENVEKLLSQRKATFATLNLSEICLEELEENIGCYVKLFEMFYESDATKKLSMFYHLTSHFEEPIVTNAFLGKLKVVEPQVELLEGTGEGKNINDNTDSTTEVESDIQEFQEEIVFEESKEVIISKEICKHELSWEDIGISDPESLVFKEDISLLSIEETAKAHTKFGVKEFRSDITKQLGSQKLDCMHDAYVFCCCSEKSLEVWHKKEEGFYELALEKLLRNGYLSKYIVKDYGEFYTLSSKGTKAFKTKESIAFMRNLSGKLDSKDVGEEIEDRANSALCRLLGCDAFFKVFSMNPNYEFESICHYMNNDFCVRNFPGVINEKNVTVFCIVSDDKKQFEQAEEYIKNDLPETDLLVVNAINKTNALNIAKWVSGMVDEKICVYYSFWNETKIYDLLTESVVGFSELIVEDTIKNEDSDMDNVEIENMEDSDCSGDKDKPTEDIVEQNDNVVNVDAVAEKCPDIISVEVKDTENVITPVEVVTNIDCYSEETIDLINEDEPEESESTEILTAALISNVQLISDAEKKEFNSIYQEMLVSNKFYCATSYLKVLAKRAPYYESVYRQLAYALNDPMEGCSYSSDTIFSVYYNDENPISDHFVVAATLRNYFLDQLSYDYSLQQLQTTLSGNSVLKKNPSLNNVVYTLQKFKTDNQSGIDRYADHREKERALWEKRLEKTRRDATDFYNNYSTGNFRESTSHKRFLDTEKLLFGPGSNLCEYLKVVMDDERDMLDLLEEYLLQKFVKDGASICEENIDAVKLYRVLDEYWELSGRDMNFAKKTSDLMGSLRTNLFKRIKKIVEVLCTYVFLVKGLGINKADAVFLAYKKIREPLLKNIKKAKQMISSDTSRELPELAGNAVLIATLEELEARLEGFYKEGSNKYFYINFLKNDKVLLDDDYIPVLDDVLELPEFSIEKRIIRHYQDREFTWEERLDNIFKGGDDYGSARLIINYLDSQPKEEFNVQLTINDVEKAIRYPRKDMDNKRKEFIEDLELAQSYGQIDNTLENRKETMIQIMETWFKWADETDNYGFFSKVLDEFKGKIKEDAQTRAIELEGHLDVYLQQNPDYLDNKVFSDTITQIHSRIQQQNYAAAEDLLNRLTANDLESGIDLYQEDYLVEFLNEYEINYHKVVNAGKTLKSLVVGSKINKDIKGANRLLENWPKGANVGEKTLMMLLNALGFNPEAVKAEAPIQSKLENYLVTLKRPQNGRKNNYKHPIAAFGSEAENRGFRVVCIFGKTDASRLIDTFKEIGNAKNTLVLLDYALTLPDRRILARKTKTDLGGKIFAVIDRVVLLYLANHYTETAVNRMLMSVIMPFAFYQPYIVKSADVMPQEIFIGRKNELEKIESPTGVNIVYGGRQLGKTALLRMAKKDIDMNENGDRAIIVNAWGKDYKETARVISEALYDEKFFKEESITENWNELARQIKNRLRDETDPVPYFLLMIDEADVFIESCAQIGYQPFDALKDIQSIGSGRFKFVVAGLRNIVRFKRTAALEKNSVLPHLESLTVKPFKAMEARELLEVPLSYLGFRFPKDNETEVLISTIFGTTNYFPGLIQLYCTKLIEAMKRDYAGYSESETPPYYVQKEHIKKVLAEQSLQHDIRDKFFITLKVADDDYYFILALLVAYHYHENKTQNGCSGNDLMQIAKGFSITKLTSMDEEKVSALMEEMRELNVLQYTGNGRYRFARHSFCQMMGTLQQIEDELINYMEG